jgi:hypothetical protein
MTIKSQLLAIRAIIATPKTHSKGYNAQNENNMPVGVNEPGAVKFCIYGAARLLEFTKAKELDLDPNNWRGYLKSKLGIDPVAANDEWTHRKLMNRLNKAILECDSNV